MAAPKHNLFALGNNGGRPKKFNTPAELEAACNNYFNWCIENKEVLTITGLFLFLQITRRTLHRWEDGEIDKDGQVFSAVAKRALDVIENAYEKKLDTFSFGGAIFALKNINREYWKDKTEQEVNSTITNVAASFGGIILPTQEPSSDTP